MAPNAKSEKKLNTLLKEKSRTTYTGAQLENIAFPVGGIGTGCVALGGWGQLRDWEIFNRPGKGNTAAFTFFSMYAKPKGGKPVAKVLQGPAWGPVTGTGSGHNGRPQGAGLPHFCENTFTGEYPFGRVDLKDASFPLKVSIEAFNPFIPLDDFNSGLPCAIFLVHVKNPKREKVDAVLYANLENKAGHPELGQNVNSSRKGKSVSGIMMTTRKHKPDSAKFGSMALSTTSPRVSILSAWPKLGWFDDLTRFWDRVAEGKLPGEPEKGPSKDGETHIGAIAIKATVKPGESLVIPVIISWYFPNSDDGWNECSGADCCKPVWKNYYSTKFADAWEVAEYVGKDLAGLEERSRTFQKALFGSSYPASVIDAVGSQISILKTPTCLRLEDGTFWGWEGCCDDCGCCAGTCSHVWNYSQTMPYLFPNLERTAREADYKNNLRKDGSMVFRQSLPLRNMTADKMSPAADGQMGNIIRFYRDWRISGDDNWLRKLWPKVKRSLEFAWQHWDADKDGVMEGVQHNTYDIEFYGPNTMMGSLYLAALRAAEEMARYLGEDDKAEEYHSIFESGSHLMDKQLFNGEWYVQKIMPEAIENIPPGTSYIINTKNIVPKGEMPKYQYGTGCLSDQLLGQWYAYMLGMGDLFSKSNTKKTAASIFKYNFRSEFYSHRNSQRIYAQDDDNGLLLCSWPKGGRSELPFPYSDEVWTGIEYHVAALLIYTGLTEKGLTVVKAVRDRHDGTRRNPWDEYECGHHYARAMSSYSLLFALSGFQYSAPEARIEFAPKINAASFRTFFSVGSGWGTWSQEAKSKSFSSKIEISEGLLTLRTVGVKAGMGVIKDLHVTIGKKEIKADVRGRGGNLRIYFATPTKVKPGFPLSISLRWK